QLLVALPFDLQHAATGQARQLTLYGAAAGAGELDQLADAVTPARLAEQVREDALLRLREQRIGQVGPRVGRGGLTDPIVRLRAHFGHVSAQNGHFQPQPLSRKGRSAFLGQAAWLASRKSWAKRCRTPP